MHRMNTLHIGPPQRAFWGAAAPPRWTAWLAELSLVATLALWTDAARAQAAAPVATPAATPTAAVTAPPATPAAAPPAAAPPAAAPPAAVAPLASWPQLDLDRYLGTWYEVARLPNRFQAQCASDTQAVYRRLPDGAVSVLNRCRTATGAWTEALGRAEPLGAATPGRLRVRFAPAWLSWWPGVWGAYWVIDLDPHYTLAAVSEPRREFLWVLSRTPKPDPAAWAALQQRLVAQGFALDALVLTPHTPSVSAPKPAPIPAPTSAAVPGSVPVSVSALLPAAAPAAVPTTAASPATPP